MLKRSIIALILSAAVVTAFSAGCGKTVDSTAEQPNKAEQTEDKAEQPTDKTEQPETATKEQTEQDKAEQEQTAQTESGQPSEQTDPAGSENRAPEPAPFTKEKEAAVTALTDRLKEERDTVYVYKDFSLTENHYTQKAKMAGIDNVLVKDMDENWQEDPYAGNSCIRCEVTTREGDWGGWLFLNGYLPKGESVPLLNDGSADGQGLDLTGAKELRFMARGEEGGEEVEFFTAGFGYNGTTGKRNVDFPDSAKKQSSGWIELTKEWKEYVIPLDDVDMSYIVCGFGYVLNDQRDGNADNVFYLDEIRFCGDIRAAQSAPVMLRSYDTENIYIQNTAFSYDNALAGMAFVSEGMQPEAQQIMDAFVYAVWNDRALESEPAQAEKSAQAEEPAQAEKSAQAEEPAQAEDAESPAGQESTPMRVRNAYAAGDISAFPGWESGAKLPGWYDNDDGAWYEDRYQVGSNVGNTSYVALALLQYYKAYGGERYFDTARALMDWVAETCTDGGDGFTGGFDGWAEGDPPTVYPFTYKSIEHNIDAYAAFKALYTITGESKYSDAADSALRFVESMYDGEQGLFMTGTLDDGVTPNTGVVVLDAQVWCEMALGDAFAPYEDALKVVETMKTEEGGYPFCLENKNGGWWAEGTAYTALMYHGHGDLPAYESAMNALCGIQLDNGLFPAATVDDLSTGMDLFDGSPWEYSTDPHIAPTAWFIMAANGFNPYVY